VSKLIIENSQRTRGTPSVVLQCELLQHNITCQDIQSRYTVNIGFHSPRRAHGPWMILVVSYGKVLAGFSNWLTSPQTNTPPNLKPPQKALVPTTSHPSSGPYIHAQAPTSDPSGTPGVRVHMYVKFGEDRAILEDLTFLTFDLNDLDKIRPTSGTRSRGQPTPMCEVWRRSGHFWGFDLFDLNDLDLWNIRPLSGAPGASLHPCVKFGEDRAIFEDLTFLSFDLNDLDLWIIRSPVALLGPAYTPCREVWRRSGHFWGFDLWPQWPWPLDNPTPSGTPGASLHLCVKFGEDSLVFKM
jgi:hypothetical protein